MAFHYLCTAYPTLGPLEPGAYPRGQGRGHPRRGANTSWGTIEHTITIWKFQISLQFTAHGLGEDTPKAWGPEIKEVGIEPPTQSCESNVLTTKPP